MELIFGGDGVILNYLRCELVEQFNFTRPWIGPPVRSSLRRNDRGSDNLNLYLGDL
jgi:hypothetical protein